MSKTILTDKQKEKFRDKVKEQVEKTGLTRINNRSCESEADYFAGAMVVMTTFNEMFCGADDSNAMDIVPPMWFIGPVTGRSLKDNWG
tara:strand:- start:976 stop:1239 length:264 start_codon:yes stop_codon:yes gene_type:complete